MRKASRHQSLHLHFGSVGLLVDDALLYYVLKNVKTVLHLATWTTKTRGFPTDDRRSLVQTIILGTQPSPTATSKQFSSRQIEAVLDLPLFKYLRGVKAVKSKESST